MPTVPPFRVIDIPPKDATFLLYVRLPFKLSYSPDLYQPFFLFLCKLNLSDSTPLANVQRKRISSFLHLLQIKPCLLCKSKLCLSFWISCKDYVCLFVWKSNRCLRFWHLCKPFLCLSILWENSALNKLENVDIPWKARNVRLLYRARQFLSHLYKSTICYCFEYCPI